MSTIRVPCDAYADEAYALLSLPRIPYVPNGSTIKGMDCQGMCEYLLRVFGIDANWSGSNAMYRDMLWVGSPEECKKTFGCVPNGAWLFILEQDGGEPSKYKADGIGNASHVGVKTGRGKGAVHSSSSRGCVAESVFADKTVPNGGWNMVGLCKYIDYGVEIDEKLGIYSAKNTEEVIAQMSTAQVATTGGSLNVREKASTKGERIGTIPNGAMVEVLEKTTSDWWMVRYNDVTGYCSTAFLQESDAVELTLDRGTAATLYKAIVAALEVKT